ncbi:cell wall-binding protein [Clostridium sp. BL-8]|uniref:cell wall-binding protein n=1 Tax=Clostridium sp. BL-8 TaxID=349938 RepID=UPI00098C5155|nr:cell wall-binding protein [Clostridium sp. BL-8]OOM80921.1 autolysin [Clostridium sp. BL-8]
MIKKLICSLLILTSTITLVPIGVSAEWKEDTSGWWYTEGNSYCTGWKKIDGLWYYFETNGYMEKGWIKDGAWWYYLQNNGAMATGKLKIKDKIYEFDNNGRWLNNSLPAKIESNSIDTNQPSEEKMMSTSNFSWFNENGNTYFKVTDGIFASGGWNIDGDIYVFNDDGVLQRGEYVGQDGSKYLLGNDGEFIKGITNENDELWTKGALTTKSTTDNYEVNLDDSKMMNSAYAYSEEPTFKGKLIQNESGDKLDNAKQKATVDGKTLYCKTNQSIYLGEIKIESTDNKSTSFPNLIAICSSTDEKTVYPGIDLDLEDGFYRNINPKIVAHKPGKVTITIDVNGTKTSFDVVVTE